MVSEYVFRVHKKFVPRLTYRWEGCLELISSDGRVVKVEIPGSIIQWLKRGEEVKLVVTSELKDLFTRDDSFELYRRYGGEWIKVWPVFSKVYELPRHDPLTGRVVYRYRVLAREAITKEDYEAIVELEQYHYASKKEVVAIWRCPKCGSYKESNVPPKCDKCGVEMTLTWIKGSLPASRFLILELLDRQPFEPRVLGYVRIDPPIPLMSRRVVTPDGKVVVERHIREKVFPEDWFVPTFWPEYLLKRLRRRLKQLAAKYGRRLARAMLSDMVRKLAIARCNTAAARIARVVIHPDYRGDGLGVLAVKACIEWVRERRVPEMKREKHLIETIAQMARYNPFFEKAGFKFVWETASGRPVLYYPLTPLGKEYLDRFLASDEYAKKHGGVLYRPKFTAVEKLKGPIVFSNITKVYSNVLDMSKLPKELQDVLKSFGVERRIVQKYVLRDVNLEIYPGEIVVVIGLSGAGKTTLLRMIVGSALKLQDERYQPTSGIVKVPENTKLAALIPGELEPKFGEESLLEHLYGKTKDEVLAVEVLNICGLSDAVFYRAKFSELSTGQKERAKIASLLAERPNLVVIDEFTAHLDSVTAQRIARKIAEVCRRAGITLVVSTNRPEVIKTLNPDKVLYVGYGSVIVKRGEEILRELGLVSEEKRQ